LTAGGLNEGARQRSLRKEKLASDAGAQRPAGGCRVAHPAPNAADVACSAACGAYARAALAARVSSPRRRSDSRAIAQNTHKRRDAFEAARLGRTTCAPASADAARAAPPAAGDAMGEHRHCCGRKQHARFEAAASSTTTQASCCACAQPGSERPGQGGGEAR
jgi:hypothetical protein